MVFWTSWMSSLGFLYELLNEILGRLDELLGVILDDTMSLLDELLNEILDAILCLL